MKKIFLILIFIIFQIRTNAENGDSSIVHVADVYYEMWGTNLFSFNTEFNLYYSETRETWPSLRISTFAFTYSEISFNFYTLSARLNQKLTPKISLYLELGSGYYTEFYSRNIPPLFPNRMDKDAVFFAGFGIKFLLWNKLLLSPSLYIVHNKAENIDFYANYEYTPTVGLSLGTNIVTRMQHLKDEYYKTTLNRKNTIILNIVPPFIFSISYARTLYKRNIIDFFLKGGLTYFIGTGLSYMMAMPYVGLGSQINPYKKFYIRYSYNMDFISGAWVTFNLGYRLGDNVGLSFKKIHPIYGLFEFSSNELRANAVTVIPMFNIDIFF